MHDGVGLTPLLRSASGFMHVFPPNLLAPVYLSPSLLASFAYFLHALTWSLNKRVPPHVYQLEGTGSLSIDGRIVETLAPLLLPNVTTQNWVPLSSPLALYPLRAS